MMKTIKYSSALLSIIFVLLLACPVAWAGVAANTSIINQASLSYNDGSGPQTVQAEVVVTVALVPGAPVLSEPADDSTPYTGPSTSLPFTYQITANGNGPNTYQVSGAVTGSANTGGATVSAPVSVTLGATITISGSTTDVLQVPSDGTANSSVNGIEVGNTVVINGEVRTVSAITDPDSGTATITLNASLSSAPAAGEPVFERQDVTVTVYSGTITASNTDITVDVQVTASCAGTSDTDTDAIVATYTSGAAELTKYVRNLTWAAGNATGTGAVSFSTNGTSYNYYTDGVAGRPGDILEYVLEARNSGTDAVDACTITDVLPAEFVAFHSNSWSTTADVLYVNEIGTELPLTEESDSDVATLTVASDTLTVHVGSSASSSTGGSIPAGVAVRITYQVTINP